MASRISDQDLLVPGLPGPTKRATRNGGQKQAPIFVTTQDLPGKHVHPLLPVGITMFILVFSFLAWNVILSPLNQKLQNQWHYGDSKVVALDVQLQGDPIQHTIAAWVYKDKSGTTWLMVTDVAKGKKPALFELEASFPSGADTTLTLWSVVRSGNQDIAVSTQGDAAKEAVLLYGDGHGNLSWTPPRTSTLLGN